ncbi:MAG: carboxymuconolactone decarboxylase family protein [Actinobacteria bacterium]|jgi:uncharacterized peroxidase-related enzyme|nr:carboxymuconolactone decarboxylase family protein [Actinomycetota bacterium]MCB1238945.1 carboxymuconolactone decarboxylase family protein [Tetrasphaera sp.]
MFIDTTAPEDAAADFGEYMEQQRQAWGFLPDYVGCFAARPNVALAWSALSRTVATSMPRRRYELVTIAAARARKSSYCAVAHATFLRDNGGGDDLRALAADPTGSTLDVVDAAVFRFAAATASDPASIRQEDIDGLRRLGLTDPEIADITYAVGVRLFFATVLDALGARLDAQTAAQVEPGVLAVLSVGRPPLAEKAPDP